MDDARANDARGGKRRLVEALTRVVAREGIAGVSVRAVAGEAGVSAGAVQHHFPTRAEMIRYAMEWTSDQVQRRLSEVPRWGDVREWTREILLELLPLDADRHRELTVWLAFVAQAEADPALAELRRRTNTMLYQLYVRIVRARRGLVVGAQEEAAAPVEPGLAADAVLLQAMVNGLALEIADLPADEATTRGPELLDRYLAVAVDREKR